MGNTTSTVSESHNLPPRIATRFHTKGSREMHVADALADIVTRIIVQVDEVVDTALVSADISPRGAPLVSPRASVAVLKEIERGLRAASMSRALRLVLLMAVEHSVRETGGAGSGLDGSRGARKYPVGTSYNGNGNGNGNGNTFGVGNGDGGARSLPRRSASTSYPAPRRPQHTRSFSMAINLPPTPTSPANPQPDSGLVADAPLGITHALIREIVDDTILEIGCMPLSALRGTGDEELAEAADRVGDAILDVVFGRARK